MVKYIEIDRAIETALLLLEEGEDEQTLAYNAALVAFVKNMEIAPAADTPRWIPVTERLPEEEGTYLVTYTDGGVTEVGSSIYLQREDGSEPYWDYFVVTAWMPLPEPFGCPLVEVEE